MSGSNSTCTLAFSLSALCSTYVFTLEDHDEEFEQLLCAIAVFHADQASFSKMQAKGKVSKKGMKADLNLLRLARDILTKRLEQYPHAFEVSASTPE